MPTDANHAIDHVNGRLSKGATISANPMIKHKIRSRLRTMVLSSFEVFAARNNEMQASFLEEIRTKGGNAIDDSQSQSALVYPSVQFQERIIQAQHGEGSLFSGMAIRGRALGSCVTGRPLSPWRPAKMEPIRCIEPRSLGSIRSPEICNRAIASVAKSGQGPR